MRGATAEREHDPVVADLGRTEDALDGDRARGLVQRDRTPPEKLRAGSHRAQRDGNVPRLDVPAATSASIGVNSIVLSG
jgi:hypothetical protein